MSLQVAFSVLAGLLGLDCSSHHSLESSGSPGYAGLENSDYRLLHIQVRRPTSIVDEP